MKIFRNKGSIVKTLVLAAILAIGAVILAQGAEDGEEGEKIKKIKLFIDSSIEAQGAQDLSVRTNSRQYHVNTYEFDNSEGSWEAGEEPRLRVYVEADEEYYFPKNLKKGNVSVSGASCISLKISEDLETAEVTVKLEPVKGTLGTVENAWWDTGSPGKAKWSETGHANAYEVKLYRGNTMVEHKDKVRGTNCNFYPYMDRQGDYTFKVRAVPSGTSEEKYLTAGEWVESEVQEISRQQAEAAPKANKNQVESSGGNSQGNSSAGGPASNGVSPGNINPSDLGWNYIQNKWKYRNLDGSYATAGWQSIDGKWYLFDMSGNMLTGWQHYGGNDYYLSSSGDMITGWFGENRKWYYFGPDGAKVTGWLMDGNDWYFLGPDGVMSTGWVKWEDKFYYMNPENGKMLRNAYADQFYVGPDGVWVP